jgi:replicative DNA helicase
LVLHPNHPDAKPAAGMPSNTDAEYGLIGAVLYDNDCFHLIEGLEAHHFFEPVNGRLWTAISDAMGASGRAIDPVLLSARFADDKGFQELGGLTLLGNMVEHCPPPPQAPAYADQIIDLAIRRDLIRICQAGAESAADPELPGRKHIETVEADLYALAEDKPEAGGFVEFGAALDAAVEAAAKAYSNAGAITGLPTGLIDLDQKLGGLHPSDLLILAGRPSMGKTALATNIAWNAAAKGKIVAFFSLEMSAEQLSGRILAAVSGVSGDRVRRGAIEAHEFARLRDAAGAIRSHPLHIDATGGLALSKLAARARRLKRRKGGLDLIVVDYLQLLTTGDRGRDSNRVQEVTQITMGLKALAKDLNVPVLALSQLSRQVENREDKRPQLSDLRESGSIEQDADCVMFVYRESYYLGRAEPKEGSSEHLAWMDDMDKARGQADVIIGKQRHGPIGSVKLHFNEDLTLFGNLAREGWSGGRDPSGGRHD